MKNFMLFPLLVLHFFLFSNQPIRGYEAIIEKPQPTIRMLDILTSINVLKGNGKNLDTAGSLYPEVEWKTGEKSSPFIQVHGTRIKATADFHLGNLKKGTSIRVEGTAKKAYSFDLSGEIVLARDISAEEVVAITLLGRQPLPINLQRLDDIIGWKVFITTPEKVKTQLDLPEKTSLTTYLVFSDNFKQLTPGSNPTPARMEHAYHRFQQATGHLALAYAPHSVVHQLNRHVSHHYNPANHFSEGQAWFVPTRWSVPGGGASCISISSYCQKVLQVLGFPGKVEIDAFFAKPENPRVAVPGGTDSSSVYTNTSSGKLKLYLVDNRNTNGGAPGGYGGMNNYEGAIVYTNDGATYFLPGGTQSMYYNKNQVLSVFISLAWARWDARAAQWQIVQVVQYYQNPRNNTQSNNTVASNNSGGSTAQTGRLGLFRRGLFGRRG